MAEFSTFDDQAELAEKIFLESQAQDWECDPAKQDQHFRTFTMPVLADGGKAPNQLDLTLSRKDFAGIEWTIALNLEPASEGFSFSKGKLQRTFCVDTPNADPVNAKWTEMTDPVVAKTQQIVTGARVKSKNGRLQS
ncbi:hypothetical protein [Marinobacter salicampi]|uniref:hypothetical protein n=1 Tax=Marinobacter salicampi TaxID=435907 RepID=UPI0014097A41|nr:hypothetical protein [Marinobacter salicampi]